jgi:hypothetical protein
MAHAIVVENNIICRPPFAPYSSTLGTTPKQAIKSIESEIKIGAAAFR